MQKRMLHASIWVSVQFGRLSNEARLLFIGTITIADDDGRLKGSPAYLRSQVFPYDDKVMIADVRRWLDEILSQKLLASYEGEGGGYLYHPNWLKYQTIRKDRYKDTNIPEPPQPQGDLGLDTPPTPPVSEMSTKRPPKRREEKKREEKIREGLLEHWNSKKVVVHKNISSDIQKEIDLKLKDYSVEDIKTSIDTYATVLLGDEYFWSYKWNLYEFLKRGLKSFHGKKPSDYLKATKTPLRTFKSTKI